MNAHGARARRHLAVGIAILAAAVVMPLAGSPTAVAGLPQLPPVSTTTPVILDTHAEPVLDWSVPPRFDASWAAWRPHTDRYDPKFVTAEAGWPLTLNGCASKSLYRIVKYSFTVEQADGSYRSGVDSTTCERTVHGLPAQGRYRVSLMLHTHGAGPGVSVAVTTNATIRDYLIVSMGDSLASGEGAPDRHGSYEVKMGPTGDITTKTKKEVEWKDKQCHRSAQSGPAFAARRYELSDAKTSVTFLSVACSGAKIQHLYSWNDYDGIGSNATKLRHQIDVVSQAVGGPRGRGIDALLISAGANNLGFGSIVERCAKGVSILADPDWCVVSGGIKDKMKTLPGEYGRLSQALKTRLPKTAEVFLNTYPANVFKGGGCGLLNVRWVGIDSKEGKAMYSWGVKLNQEIAAATKRYDWTLVEDLTPSFGSRAYCPRSGSWFESFEGSWNRQGDEYGTAHPNYNGHRQYGKLIQQAIGSNPG